MHTHLRMAQPRLERAMMTFQELNRQDFSAERLAVALSRLVIFTNTMATAIQSMSRDPDAELLGDCADLLWSFGEELRTINPDWFGSDEAR